MTEDLSQVLVRFCLVLPHIIFGTLHEFWISPQFIPLSLKCLNHGEQTRETGLLLSLLPIYFPSHSQLATGNTDNFGSCMDVRSIVSDIFPLSTEAGVEALKEDQREAWFIVWILHISLSFHAIVLFAPLVCSISGKWSLLIFFN